MAKITPIDIIKGVSVVDTPPFVLRSFSVRTPFALRSGIEERTENERRMIED